MPTSKPLDRIAHETSPGAHGGKESVAAETLDLPGVRLLVVADASHLPPSVDTLEHARSTVRTVVDRFRQAAASPLTERIRQATAHLPADMQWAVVAAQSRQACIAKHGMVEVYVVRHKRELPASFDATPRMVSLKAGDSLVACTAGFIRSEKVRPNIARIVAEQPAQKAARYLISDALGHNVKESLAVAVIYWPQQFDWDAWAAPALVTLAGLAIGALVLAAALIGPVIFNNPPAGVTPTLVLSPQVADVGRVGNEQTGALVLTQGQPLPFTRAGQATSLTLFNAPNSELRLGTLYVDTTTPGDIWVNRGTVLLQQANREHPVRLWVDNTVWLEFASVPMGRAALGVHWLPGGEVRLSCWGDADCAVRVGDNRSEPLPRNRAGVWAAGRLTLAPDPVPDGFKQPWLDVCNCQLP